jgi:hypothetical protein
LTDELAQIERDIADGRASATSLVQLFNVASEAEQQRDINALKRACEVAKRLTETLENELAADAVRLLGHCTELLARVQTAEPASPAPAAASTCPGCGRPLEGNPVRCRACGELLI